MENFESPGGTLQNVAVPVRQTSAAEKADTGAIIDLTFASNSLTRGAKWEVSGIYTASDHLAIILLG